MALCGECQKLYERDDRSGPRVAVFGAGIAGLTAAHELVERGFAVDVFETATEVGGLAATQYFTSERVFGVEAAKAAKQAAARGDAMGARPGIVAGPVAGAKGKPKKQADEGRELLTEVVTILQGIAAGNGKVSKSINKKIGAVAARVAAANAPDGNPRPLTLPGEHGFRAFYSFYRHVTDTMQRIPLTERLADDERVDVKRRPGPIARTVADNLIPTHKVAVALEGNIFREIEYDRRQPRSATAASYVLGLWMVSMGFAASDIARVMTRLLQFLTSCRERRYRELNGISLLEYLGTDGLSKKFKQQFKAMSRFLIAIDPETGDALTQAMVMCRLLMDPVVTGEADKNQDRVLNGPTSERWFDPWQFFLSQQKVKFVFGQKLKKFELTDRGGEKKVSGANVFCSAPTCPNGEGYWLTDGRPRKRARAKPAAGGRPTGRPYSYFVSAIPGDALWQVMDSSDGLLKADSDETQAVEEMYDANLATPLDVQKILKPPPKGASAKTVTTLAAEQRALWIENARALAVKVTGDPPLSDVIELFMRSKRKGARRQYGPWMSGIQFYLSDSLTVLPGHIHFPDSKWALTAVCQSQFWGGDFYWRYGATQVRSIISVDICEFKIEGEFIKKRAIDCSEDEIAQEVWYELKKGLQAWDLPLPDPYPPGSRNPLRLPGQRLHDRKILANLKAMKKETGRTPPIPVPYLDHHLDDRIVRSSSKINGSKSTVEYFVPLVDSWQRRPGPLPPMEAWDQGYRVRLGSLVIVGHFAQTFTSINTMEAANESARHGVNAIIAHYEGKKGDYVHMERCTIWPLEADEPADLDFLKQVDRDLFWDDKTNAPKEDEDGNPPGHVFELLQLDRWVAAMLPSLANLDTRFKSNTRLWDSDGWKRFESNFGGLWEKVLTLGRFSTPFS